MGKHCIRCVDKKNLTIAVAVSLVIVGMAVGGLLLNGAGNNKATVGDIARSFYLEKMVVVE